jgi:hypothetical protein
MKRFVPIGVAAAAFFLAAIVWIGSDRTIGERVFDEYSVESTAPEGLSIAFRYLRRTGHHVARLDAPLRANIIPSNAVLIRAGVLTAPAFAADEERTDDKKSKKAPKQDQRTAPLLTPDEEEWVRGGGRLVLVTPSVFGPLQMREGKTAVAVKVFPIWPGVVSIATPAGRTLSPSTLPARMHALFTIDGGPAIARETIGKGEVIVIAIAEVLQNRYVRWRGALPLIEAVAPANRPVYFDESIHAFDADDGAVTIMKEWSLGPFLALLALAALLHFWREASRLGPPEDDLREARSDAVDLVRSLGTLYMSAMTDDEAIAMYRDALMRSVAAQSGLRGEALHRRVSDLTQHDVAISGSRGMKARAFRRHLDTINEAFRKLEHGRASRAAGDLHANHR